jgi:hypothetical protein
MAKTFLFLDDIRFPIDVSLYITKQHKHIFINERWIIVRNYKEFCDYIEKKGVPDCVAFDHDLADEHYYNNETFKEKTGYDCAKFLKDWCEEKNLSYPELIICHSMNPIGKKNIYDVFKNVKKLY